MTFKVGDKVKFRAIEGTPTSDELSDLIGTVGQESHLAVWILASYIYDLPDGTIADCVYAACREPLAAALLLEKLSHKRDRLTLQQIQACIQAASQEPLAAQYLLVHVDHNKKPKLLTVKQRNHCIEVICQNPEAAAKTLVSTVNLSQTYIAKLVASAVSNSDWAEYVMDYAYSQPVVEYLQIHGYGLPGKTWIDPACRIANP